MKYNTSRDQKIKVSIGSVEYLVREVEQNRRRLETLEIENRVMNNFFSLVNRLGDQPRQGYGEERFRDAKKEFEAAVELIETPQPDPDLLEE